jgi:hypothetical protein
VEWELSDHLVTVTVMVLFARDATSSPRLETQIADALMALPAFATVRIEFAPKISVCRADVQAADADAAIAEVVAAIAQVSRELTAGAQIASVSAETVPRSR